MDGIDSSRRLAGIGSGTPSAPAMSYASRNLGRGKSRNVAESEVTTALQLPGGTTSATDQPGVETNRVRLADGAARGDVARDNDAAARKEAALAVLEVLAGDQQHGGDVPVLEATPGVLRPPATSRVAKAIAAYNKALGVPASARPNSGLGLLRDDERYLFDRDRSALSRASFTL